MITNEEIFKEIKADMSEEEKCISGYQSFHYFEVYYYLGAILRPKRVMEIGTRLGYSLVAIWKGCKTIEYILSCDNECFLGSSQIEAEGNIVKSGYRGDKDFVVADSHSDYFKNLVEELPEFDLVHIDGDHSYKGKIEDLEIAIKAVRKNGLVLVDDYTHEEIVKKAVDDFVRKFSLSMVWVPTFQGLAVIQK